MAVPYKTRIWAPPDQDDMLIGKLGITLEKEGLLTVLSETDTKVVYVTSQGKSPDEVWKRIVAEEPKA